MKNLDSQIMVIRAIAIDDDPTSTLALRQVVDRIKGLELINTFEDSIKGAAGIILEKPDLIFLDIEMPDFNGLEIMKSLVNPPNIIVISGNDDFENRALELNAVTFISKPPSEEEVEIAVEKVRELLLSGATNV